MSLSDYINFTWLRWLVNRFSDERMDAVTKDKASAAILKKKNNTKKNSSLIAIEKEYVK